MKQRKPMRRKGHDYAQAGMYFITICTKDRKHVFGTVINGKMILNDVGKIAHDEWFNTITFRKNVTLGAFVVMPNHIHGIIIITARDVSHTSAYTNETSHENNTNIDNIQDNALIKQDVYDTSTNVSNENTDLYDEMGVSPIKTDVYDASKNTDVCDASKKTDVYDASKKTDVCDTSKKTDVCDTSKNTDVCDTSKNTDVCDTSKNTDVCNTSLRSPSKTIGAIVRGYKSSVTRQINALQHANNSVWQGNYHERMITNEKSLQIVSKYILCNPQKWSSHALNGF